MSLALSQVAAAAVMPREIVFVGPYGGRGANVLAIRADGTNLRLLAANGYTPRWSPGGTRIVFARAAQDPGPSPTTGLAVVPAAGGAAASITSGADSSPAWSPDGRWIAFSRFENGTTSLYVVAPDGTRLRKLRAAVRGPGVWAPDSRRLLVPYRNGLATIDLAGRLRRLPHARCAADGSWSPNGRWIAFASCVDRTRSRFGISVEYPDGGSFRRLTRSSSDADPAWAPDSRRLAFVRSRAVGYLEHTEIRMISIGGKNLGNLDSVAQDHDEHPQWSPSGRQIVFDRDAAVEPIGEADRLYVGDARTGRVRKLYDNIARGMQSWRPR
jgi:TolB protein